MHRFSRRASPPNTKPPRDHRTCPYVVQFHFQDNCMTANAHISRGALRNLERTFHVLSHPRTATVRRPERRRRYSARHRHVGLGGMLQHRPAGRQAPPAQAPRARAARYDGPLAANTPRYTAPAVVASQPRPAAPQRAQRWPRRRPRLRATTGRVRGCFSMAYRVSSCPPGRGAQRPRLRQVWLSRGRATAPREL